MKINDAFLGVFFIVIGVLAFVYAGTFRTMPGVTFGPSVFPRLVAVIMVFGGAILVVNGLRAARTEPFVQLDAWARSLRSYNLLLATIGSMLAYIVFSQQLGFLLTASLVLMAMLVVTRGRKYILSSAIISLIVTAALYYMFARVLRVPLPFGIIENWLLG